jgi:predicted nucleotidyltransferase/predicted transcriptional regulator
MRSVLTEPVAAAVVVLDEAGRATLSDIAKVSGRAISTVQRAIEALERDEIVRRETARGAIVFRPGAPRQALREVAEWVLGSKKSRALTKAAQPLHRDLAQVPLTIQDAGLRDALPRALDAIVTGYRPAQVILFGSQARGDATPHSDVDLLVVFDHLGDRRGIRAELKRLLRDAPFAKDILVATPHDVAHPMPGTAIAEAAHEGLVVYER